MLLHQYAVFLNCIPLAEIRMKLREKPNLEKKIVFWSSLGHFSNHVGNYLTPALLIYMQTDIALSQTQRGVLGSIPMIILIFLSTLIGYLGDKKPLWSKHIIWVGILGIGLFGFLMSIANSFTHLMLATVVLGFSLSTYHPLAFNFINRMNKNKDRNMGILSVSGNFGTAITPLAAMVFVVLTNDWRTAFVLFSIMQILIGISFAIQFPNDQETQEELNNNNTNNSEIPFSNNQIKLLLGLIVLVSVFRAPVFRCISYFTTIIFSDAFNFDKIESSVLSAIILAVGASATFIAGILNNRKTKKKTTRSDRVSFRSNTMLLSCGVSALFLILLALIPTSESLTIFLTYLTLTFFYFLGAAIIPAIISEIVSNQGISSIYGVMFSSATLASAIAPTVFGILADNYGFEASFLFLGAISLICFFFIVLFVLTFRSYTKAISPINLSL